MERLWNSLPQGSPALWTNLAIAFLAITVFFAFAASSPKRRWWVRLLLGLPWSIGLFGTAYYGYSYIDALFDAYGQIVSSAVGKTLVGMMVILFGLAAYLLRHRNKVLYGQLEVFFAAASAAGIASKLKPGETLLSQWVGLMGAAYVVSRGMNNWADGLREKPDKYGNRTITGYLKSRILVDESKSPRTPADAG
jgi:hypothetical protein